MIGFVGVNVKRTKLVGVALVMFAATVWLYWPSVHGEFLRGDDVEYLRQSERWNGLTWNAVKWAFTETTSYYHPLVRLSHVLDYQIWGRNAAGHHAASVVVHALNAMLVFGFLWTLLGATPLTTAERLAVALWVAVVFAIHPLQVESVAWIAGQTQLLCTTFGIGSLWAYVGGARRSVVWGLFIGALLCKPMAVSLPFVMLAMDYYPLRRYEQLGWGRLLREKAPWIGLAAVAGLATLITKSPVGEIVPLPAMPLSGCVFLAFESLTFYLLKLVWPSHLSPYYPIPSGLSFDQWPVLASVLTVILITVVVVIERRRLSMLVAAWGAYVALVLPVSGLVPAGTEVIATRHAYVAMLPVLLLAGAAGVWVWRRSATTAHLALVGLLAAQLAVFGVRTRGLIPFWHDDETEQRAALVEFPDSQVNNRFLVMTLLEQGRASEALPYAQRILVKSPDSEVNNRLLALTLLATGRAGEALPYAQRDVELAPKQSFSHITLGLVLRRLGQRQEGLAQDEQALRINPNAAEAHYNFGVALAEVGRVQEAIAQYEEALRLNPQYAEAQMNFGNALLTQGDVKDATAHYEEALRLNPNYPQAHDNLGIALAKAGRVPDAMNHWEEALRLKPDDVEAHYNLGNALQGQGRVPEAIEQFKQVLKLRPGFAPASNALARLGAGP